MAKSPCNRAKQLANQLIDQYANHPVFGPGLWDLADQHQWYFGCRRLCGAITDCSKGLPNENELTAERDAFLALLSEDPSDDQRTQINGALQSIRDSLPP